MLIEAITAAHATSEDHYTNEPSGLGPEVDLILMFAVLVVVAISFVMRPLKPRAPRKPYI